MPKSNLALRCFGAAVVGFVLGLLMLQDSDSKMTSTEAAVDLAGFKVASASPTGMTCPRSGPTMSVPAMQRSLRKHGIFPSPLEKFALTSFAATRDVSMAAQAEEEFAKLDHESQAKIAKLSRDVVVRAATLKPEEMAGVTEPLGFWDPAGFSKEGDVAAYRRAELKHGRVCMVASLGVLVEEFFHPIFDNWGEGPFVSAVQSHFSETATKNFWPAFWIMAAGHELATTFADYPGKEEFDYGFDPLNLKPQNDTAALKELQNKELNNGRLAMLASAGIIAQELVTGKSLF